MKINKNYIVKNVIGEVVIVPTGETAQYFNGLISTNQVAGFIWENMEKCDTPEDMLKLVLENFDVEEEQARNDVLGFLDTLKKAKMIEY